MLVKNLPNKRILKEIKIQCTSNAAFSRRQSTTKSTQRLESSRKWRGAISRLFFRRPSIACTRAHSLRVIQKKEKEAFTNILPHKKKTMKSWLLWSSETRPTHSLCCKGKLLSSLKRQSQNTEQWIVSTNYSITTSGTQINLGSFKALYTAKYEGSHKCRRKCWCIYWLQLGPHYADAEWRLMMELPTREKSWMAVKPL